MTIRPIPPFADDGDGLDFAEFFQDSTFVRSVLWNFAVHLGAAVCYCLKFHGVPGGQSWFEPYPPDGLITNSGIGDLPNRIHYERLLSAGEWPILAEWSPEGPSDHPLSISNAAWHGQARLKVGQEYVGYFKAAIPANQKPPTDLQLKDAYRQAYLFLEASITVRRHQPFALNSALRVQLLNTHAAIDADIKDGNPHKAVQRVCSLLTSHTGADFNRVICLAPVVENVLECIYAHGGDCSDDFSSRVQLPLSRAVHTISQVQDCVHAAAFPIDDPFFAELASPRSLRLAPVHSSQSVVASLWRNNGNLDQLPLDQTIRSPEGVELLPEGIVRLKPMPVLAAEVNIKRDPLFCSLDKPGSALFCSRNNTFFAIPWTCGGNPKFIVLVDLGYWGSYQTVHDVLPRLVMARALLSDFAPHFVGVSSW